ncbi:MAG: glycosyltransferase family 2 protein [Gammaproteobacteria bacterium]|nr:glycosyltransferase family 2 protein [Gammaproteobacteria bacterium]
MPPISVLILTLNEEANLADCLRSCAWCDDIVVFDSMSTDGTREIAARAAVRFHERRFDNYAAQRNAALTEITYKHSWVLMVDADERVTPALVAEMERAVAVADPDMALFRMRRMDYFLGRWLRRSSGYPSWFGRLVKLGRVRVAREVNEEYLADGKVGHLREHLIHHPFNKGIAYWIERHNRYSTMEAVAVLEARTTPIDWIALVGLEPIARRRELKKFAYRLPLRPAIVFMYLYVLRGGFLDGRAGFAYSRMRAAYELFIDLKVLEASRRRRGEPV